MWSALLEIFFVLNIDWQYLHSCMFQCCKEQNISCWIDWKVLGSGVILRLIGQDINMFKKIPNRSIEMTVEGLSYIFWSLDLCLSSMSNTSSWLCCIVKSMITVMILLQLKINWNFKVIEFRSVEICYQEETFNQIPGRKYTLVVCLSLLLSWLQTVNSTWSEKRRDGNHFCISNHFCCLD